jgi:hypothetical protein
VPKGTDTDVEAIRVEETINLTNEVPDNPRVTARRINHVAGHPSAGKLEPPLPALKLRTPQ